VSGRSIPDNVRLIFRRDVLAEALLGRPGHRRRLAVAALRLRAADGDDLEAVGPGREGAHDLGRDADQVPLPQR
jgi:hypothetical protein